MKALIDWLLAKDLVKEDAAIHDAGMRAMRKKAKHLEQKLDKILYNNKGTT